MTDGCHNCRNRLELEKWDYRGKGCEHTQTEGFVCTAMASEGVAVWMLGADDGICECWKKRKEPKWNE